MRSFLIWAGLAGAAAMIHPLSASEQVLFAFDNRALPLQQSLQLKLVSYTKGALDKGNVVLPPGPPSAPDSAIHFYGNVLKVNGELWMWYLGGGNQDPWSLATDKEHQPDLVERVRICLAKSKDGKHWERPALGLVEYAGNRDNNLVDLYGGQLPLRGFVVIYEPEDADPARRFKMVLEADKFHSASGQPTGVAYSADGLRWKASPANPSGPWCEPSGLIKWHGVYYLSGHQISANRELCIYMSYDFEHWIGAPSLGFQRGPTPQQRAADMMDSFDGEQVHLGASLWNRGNVIIGFYGQWHGTPTGDRRLVTIDLGMVVSHDALHYFEPIPNFKIVRAGETGRNLPTDEAAEVGRNLPFQRAPSLVQGNAFINQGDETLFWYSTWGLFFDGVRLAVWPRDRLGYLQPWIESAHLPPYLISDIVPTEGRPVKIGVNASGLSDLSRLKVSVLDERFNPLPGFGAADCTGPVRSGFHETAAWGNRNQVVSQGPIRVRVDFAGIRPEDLKLYAVYVTPEARK